MRRPGVGEILILIGCAAWFVGFVFIPWYETSARPDVGVHGYEGGVVHWVTVALAVALVVLVVAGFWRERDEMPSGRGWILMVLSLAIVGLSLIDIFVLEPESTSDSALEADWGAFVSLGGATLAVLGSAGLISVDDLARSRRRAET